MISLRVLFRHAALVLVVVIASFATTIHTQRHASSIRGQTITARHTSSLWQRQLQWPEYASGNVRQPVKPIEPYWSNDYAPPDYRYSATAPQSKSKSKTAPLGQGSFVSSSVYCKVPYPGYGPIPPDLWLGTFTSLMLDRSSGDLTCIFRRSKWMLAPFTSDSTISMYSH